MKTVINTTLKELQADATKREIRLILTMVGLVVGGIAILGFILN